MKLFFFIIVAILSVTACTPHKFDVSYKINSKSYVRKLELVEKNNQINIRNHEVKKLEVELANRQLEKKNKIPSGIRIETSNYSNHFMIYNGMNEDLFIEFEKSSMVLGNESFRVVSGKTRKLDLNRLVPDKIIAAGTQAEVSFYSDEADSSHYLYYDKLNISFRVGNQRYRIEKFRELSATPPNLQKRPDLYLGRVSYLSSLEEQLCGWTMIIYGGYCWFIGDADESDFEEARKIASYRFGVPADEINLIEIND